MLSSDKLWKMGRELVAGDIQDTYTDMVFRYNLPNYRIFSLGTILKDQRIERGKDLPDYVIDFIAEQAEVLAIANRVGNKVLCITFRTLKEKRFLTYGEFRMIPYGIGCLAEDFKYGDLLVLVEGMKDRDSLGTVYPNVLATSTAGLSTMMREIVLTLTDKFLLLYDNDEAGKHANFRDRKILTERGCTVVIGTHPENVKDCGEIIDQYYKCNDFQAKFLQNYYLIQVRSNQ